MPMPQRSDARKANRKSQCALPQGILCVPTPQSLPQLRCCWFFLGSGGSGIFSNHPFYHVSSIHLPSHNPFLTIHSQQSDIWSILQIYSPDLFLIEVALILTFNGQSWAGRMLSSKSLGKLRQPMLRVPRVTRKGHGSETLQVTSTGETVKPTDLRSKKVQDYLQIYK